MKKNVNVRRREDDELKSHLAAIEDVYVSHISVQQQRAASAMQVAYIQVH